jgi:hypothetical protein BACCOPRO_03691
MKKLLYIVPLLCLGAFSSCDDAIDLEPKDKVDIEGFFNSATATDLQMFSNYFYNNLLSQAMDNEPTLLDQDDVKINQNLSAVLKGGTYRTVPASGSGWSWGVLRRINTLLEYIDRCPDKAAVKQYTGVARFFRAYFYFEKVKRFGDVPWIDRQLGSADDQLYAPRDSRELIMTKMLEDIDFAIDALPSISAESSAPYRLTKGAALALKSNFCLFEGTYRKYHEINIEGGHDWRYYLGLCVDASEKLMSGTYGKYSLVTGTDAYMNMFAAQDANKNEYILAVKYDQGMQILHNANAHTVVPTQGQPGYTRKFICSYLMKDGSRFTDKPGWQTMQFADEVKDRDPRLTQSIRGLNYHRIGSKTIEGANLLTSRTGYQPIKFVGESMMGSINMDKNNMSSNDLPEYRYAEILLNLAEAKAELETLTQTDINNTINELRRRVGMTGMLDMATANAHPDPYLDGSINPESGYFNVSAANKGVILEIRRERTIELVQEGRRIYDLFRWKCGKMIDQPMYGQYFPGPGAYDVTGDGVADIYLYAEGTAKPAGPSSAQYYEIGKDIYLSDGNSGYLDNHRGQDRQGFNENRDYLYPIPTDDLNLNPNLTQNPGWGAASGK